ncbi:MAG: MASE3 domain-containing protein [Actinomycetota bacterium]
MIGPFFKRNYATIILGLLSLAGLYLISLYSYVLYHSFAELFSIVIAFAIFIIAWNSKRFLDNHFLLFAGIAYFFIAVLDLLHTLAYEGMGVFTGYVESNLATQLWISARYVESISMLLALLFITRRLNYKLQVTFYSAATALILLSIFYWEIFPVCFVEGHGLTTFKIASEYIISFMLAMAILFLHMYRKEFNRTVFRLIVVSLFITILSEMFFTLYSDVYGLFNQLGHFLKLLSFFLIYKAIVETGFSQPMDLLFFKLRQREKEIKESEEKFRSLYFSMNEAVCLQEMIYDKSKKPVDYRILDVNHAYLGIMGLERSQVIGKKASEVYRTDIAPYLGVYEKVLKTGKPAKFEAYFPPMKKYFSVSVFSPSRGKFATIFSDITKRKKIEKEIKSLSRFPLENPNPVMRINDKNKVIYTNKPAKNMLRQLGNRGREKLLESLMGLSKSPVKENRYKPKRIEVKIAKSFYELTVTPVKNFNYFNIYGTDVTARKKAEKLEKKIAKEKALSSERDKLARELHDTVTQTLFSANMVAGTIPKLWEKDPGSVAKRLGEIERLHDIALEEMRILLYELRPASLKDEDLGNLLRGLVKSVEARSKTTISLTIKGEDKFLPKIEIGFYRIVQEAINNIIKHSKAANASIILKTIPGELYMDIKDDGRGFKREEIDSTSLGLNIMQERAKIIGASINIDSSPGEGTRITVVYKKARKNKAK